jgi:hypothetical protein
MAGRAADRAEAIGAAASMGAVARFEQPFPYCIFCGFPQAPSPSSVPDLNFLDLPQINPQIRLIAYDFA